MTDIITILYILFAFCTIVALAGVVFAIRLRIKSESFKNNEEGEAGIVEAMGLNTIDSSTFSNMKKIKPGFENLPLMTDLQSYYTVDPLIEKNSDLGIREVLKSPNVYGSPRRPAGIRDIGEEKLDEKVKKPDEKIIDFSLYKERYGREIGKKPSKRRRKMLGGAIGGVY